MPRLFSGPNDRRIRRALCVVAHPDDIEFYCAGSVLLMTRRGVTVDFALATSGDLFSPWERTSPFVTRPSRPVPWTLEVSTPFSAAIFCAAGITGFS